MTEKKIMSKEEMDAVVELTKKHLLGVNGDQPDEHVFLNEVYNATSGRYGEPRKLPIFMQGLGLGISDGILMSLPQRFGFGKLYKNFLNFDLLDVKNEWKDELKQKEGYRPGYITGRIMTHALDLGVAIGAGEQIYKLLSKVI